MKVEFGHCQALLKISTRWHYTPEKQLLLNRTHTTYYYYYYYYYYY